MNGAVKEFVSMVLHRVILLPIIHRHCVKTRKEVNQYWIEYRLAAGVCPMISKALWYSWLHPHLIM